MTFDIIDISDEEVEALSVIQLKLLRTAQKTKDEWQRKFEAEMETYRKLLYSQNMEYSTLYQDEYDALNAKLQQDIDILREQLQFNMSLGEPTTPDDMGGSDGDESAGYPVDYSLSYIERYVLVRDYYMSISDPNERLALYTSDDTARRYLNSYYTTLYNYLVQFV